MRENPSQGTIEWALSRFGPEWVEANLFVQPENEQIQTPQIADPPQPVKIRRAAVFPRKGRSLPRAWVRERSEMVYLTDFRHPASPSVN